MKGVQEEKVKRNECKKVSKGKKTAKCKEAVGQKYVKKKERRWRERECKRKVDTTPWCSRVVPYHSTNQAQ